jgi:hypothetical protein
VSDSAARGAIWVALFVILFTILSGSAWDEGQIGMCVAFGVLALVLAAMIAVCLIFGENDA